MTTWTLLRLRWMPCALQCLYWLLQLAHLAQPAIYTNPYSCQIDGGPLSLLRERYHPFDTSMIFGMMGSNTSYGIISLHTEMSSEDDGVTYTITLGRSWNIKFERSPPLNGTSGDNDYFPNLLVPNEFRYFKLSAQDGQIKLIRPGQTDASLISIVNDPHFVKPKYIHFRTPSIVVHSCSTATPTPSLGCRSMTLTNRYDFSEGFPLAGEEVSLTETTKAIRFMVRAPRDVYVRLKGSPSSIHYEIDLNFVNKIAIQRVAAYLDTATCYNCLSPNELRLFQVVYNATRLELYEGTSYTTPAVSVPKMNFKITHISFASMSAVGSVLWMHACQGLEKALNTVPELAPSRPSASTRPPPTPVFPQLRAKAPTSPLLEGCRIVNTFKYRFDGYFSIAEEGLIEQGTKSILPFLILGRKDVHLQLVSTIPPTSDETYEIDIDFYNHTNLDRGSSSKVASVQHFDLLSATELRGFIIEHDYITGVLKITTADGRPVLLWRDPKPFALRYFSVCSGSSAGNDTTWVLGGPGTNNNVLKDVCSRPLLTYTYSHSQFLSVNKVGVINGTQRTINVFLRASGSGHIRLENSLPPAMEAQIEVRLFGCSALHALHQVDLSHEGITSIDVEGKRVASKATPGLLSVREARGFWVRQDVKTRRLEVGQFGEREPLVSWMAPNRTNFPEVRFFSLATSRSVGNGTWYYGCRDGQKPDDADVTVEGEHVEGGGIDIATLGYGGSAEDTETTLPPGGRGSSGLVIRHPLPASKALFLRFRMIDQPPPDGTNIGLSLHIMKVYLDDMTGMVVLRGQLTAVWKDKNIEWEPKDYEDIRDVNTMELSWAYTPEFSVHNGDLEMGGLLHLDHTGLVRWESSLMAQAHCVLDATAWPQDQHTCEINLNLVAGQSTQSLSLLNKTMVDKGASFPLWKLLSLSANVTNETTMSSEKGVSGSGTTNSTVRIVVSLRRTVPVLHHILLAPFIVLSAMCLLAYWVREPLPRDKMILGCGSLVLLVFAFLVLEAACPPGLVGMPNIVVVYCWCLALVAMAVIVSAVTTAVTRDTPTRNPPAVVCSVLSTPFVRGLLILSVNQVHHRVTEDRFEPDAVDYKKGSSQVYMQFDHISSPDCRCNDKACSKQVAMEARYYWALVAMASERILSILCFVLMLIAAFLVK